MPWNFFLLRTWQTITFRPLICLIFLLFRKTYSQCLSNLLIYYFLGPSAYVHVVFCRYKYVVLLGAQLLWNLTGIIIWHFISSDLFKDYSYRFFFLLFSILLFNSALIQWAFRLVLWRTLVLMCVAGLGSPQWYLLTLYDSNSWCISTCFLNKGTNPIKNVLKG